MVETVYVQELVLEELERLRARVEALEKRVSELEDSLETLWASIEFG